MKKRHLSGSILLLFAGCATVGAQKQWTLKDCIDYALSNNIQIQKSKINEDISISDFKTAKAGLLPALSANVSQGATYRPFQESVVSFVNGGATSNSSNKLTQTGSYGINAAWMIWNGGKNVNNVTSRRIDQSLSKLATQEAEHSIQEQITQLYVQILYSVEALRVNEELLKNDELEYSRGKEMKAQGQMSLSELARLEAQVTNGNYNVVNSRTIIENYKLQLKQILELQGEDCFDIVPLPLRDEQTMVDIPDKQSVYAAAIAQRPEILSEKLNIEASEINLKTAKAGYLPTISITAGIGDNHTIGSGKSFSDQMKQSLNGSIGVSISIPIFDNRQNKNAVEKAKLNKTTGQLDLLNAQKEVYSTIETYWFNAVNNQQKYVAAKYNVKSIQASFSLLNEQFHLGLKNIVELQTERANLLNATQQLLESKYTTLLNIQLLKFYAGEEISL